MRNGGLEVLHDDRPRLQEVGLEAMRSALPYSTDPSSALVSIDPRNGQIGAMVSSSNYDQSQFNLAAQGHRQPGSTFKAFVLTTAIKQGIDPYTTYYTSKPLDLNLPQWGHWEVHTADEGYLGTVNLQQATVASDNTVFAQLDLDVGPEAVAATAKSMGITSAARRDPGRGDRRPAARRLAAGDDRRLRDPRLRRHPPRPGRDRARSSSPTARSSARSRPTRSGCCSEAVAYEVTRLLHDNITEGTGTAAYTGCAGQAGKTGTTDEYTDAWFAGYQPNLATAVWVGYPQSNEIEMTSVHGITVFGGTFPAEIWHSLYSDGGVPCEEFERAEAADQLGALLRPASPSRARATAAGAERRGGSGEADRRPGSAAVGGYNPERLRAGRRAGTGAAAPAAAAAVGGGGRRRRSQPASG